MPCKIKLLLLFFSIWGIFLSVIFWTYNESKNTTSQFLACFFFLISLYAFSQYGLLYSKSVVLITALLVLFPIIVPPFYLMGPMLYFYVRSVLSDHSGMRRLDFLHVIPMILFFGAALPFAFLPLSEKVDTAMQFANNIGIMQTYSATFLSKIFPVSAIYLSRPVLLLAYTIWSMVLMAKYFLRNKHRQVFRRQQFMIKWLVLLLVLVLFLVTSHIILIFHAFKMHFSDIASGLKMVRMLSALGLTGLMISPILFPSILYGLPRLPDNHKKKPKKTGKITLKNIKKLPHQNDYAYQQDIGQRMDNYMKEYKPYLQPHFNMNQLAVQLEIPFHHLAYYFKEERKQTFSEYRNHWRVEHAKKLFMEGKNSELTLEAIASLSGFSNRNSFCTIFQKTEGICPSTFAGQHKVSS